MQKIHWIANANSSNISLKILSLKRTIGYYYMAAIHAKPASPNARYADYKKYVGIMHAYNKQLIIQQN
jgi:hypothetical protein